MKNTLLALCLTLAMSLAASTFDDGVPHKVEMVPPAFANAGDTVTIYVTLDHVTADDQTVNISADTAFWSSIPSTVQVNSGQSVGSFQATSRTTASGSTTVTASCNGGSAQLFTPPIIE